MAAVPVTVAMMKVAADMGGKKMIAVVGMVRLRKRNKMVMVTLVASMMMMVGDDGSSSRCGRKTDDCCGDDGW